MTIWDKSNEQKIAPKSRSYIFACKRKQQQQRERKGNKKDIAETRDYSELVRALRIWTRDLQIFSLTLSQLSYLGNWYLQLE